jgi:predicted nucleic acid-binding protein
MGTLALDTLPPDALVLVDSAPIIYVLDGNGAFAERFRPLFEAQASGRVRLAVSTVAIAEVLTGPLQSGDEGLARRYRSVLDSWRVVDLTSDVAETAARLRSAYRLKLADAVQVASALAIGADALVTHDRDFARVRGVRVLS